MGSGPALWRSIGPNVLRRKTCLSLGTRNRQPAEVAQGRSSPEGRRRRVGSLDVSAVAGSASIDLEPKIEDTSVKLIEGLDRAFLKRTIHALLGQLTND